MDYSIQRAKWLKMSIRLASKIAYYWVIFPFFFFFFVAIVDLSGANLAELWTKMIAAGAKFDACVCIERIFFVHL